MFKSILFVCVGNVCRSPTAEVMMQRELRGRGIQVASAGLGALVGHPVDETAQQILLEHGFDAAEHRARQINSGILASADLVLVMERKHLKSISEQMPEASGKSFLLGKWQAERDIPDPYRQQRPAFEHVYRLIAEGIQTWRRYL